MAAHYEQNASHKKQFWENVHDSFLNVKESPKRIWETRRPWIQQHPFKTSHFTFTAIENRLAFLYPSFIKAPLGTHNWGTWNSKKKRTAGEFHISYLTLYKDMCNSNNFPSCEGILLKHWQQTPGIPLVRSSPSFSPKAMKLYGILDWTQRRIMKVNTVNNNSRAIKNASFHQKIQLTLCYRQANSLNQRAPKYQSHWCVHIEAVKMEHFRIFNRYLLLFVYFKLSGEFLGSKIS